MELGAQLYTLRDYTTNLQDFAETLKKVADIGYRTVQVSGACEYRPEWLKEQLQKNGLRCILTHSDPETMRQDPLKAVEEHKAFDCKYIGIGCIPNGWLDFKKAYMSFAEQFIPVAKIFREQGSLLMYHNHDIEFARSDDGRIYLERMAEDFAPDEMGFTLDTYWVQAGGGDPAYWIKKLSGRVPCIHLKDMTYDNGGMRMAPVGAGNMNFDTILLACEQAGAEYLLVEQDDCYDKNPFDCLELSYKNLKARGLK